VLVGGGEVEDRVGVKSEEGREAGDGIRGLRLRVVELGFSPTVRKAFGMTLRDIQISSYFVGFIHLAAGSKVARGDLVRMYPIEKRSTHPRVNHLREVIPLHRPILPHLAQ
jgi:hypothetical protein